MLGLSSKDKKLRQKPHFSWCTKGESTLSHSLRDNMAFLQKSFQGCSDIVFREFGIGNGRGPKGAVIFFEGLVDKKIINDNVLKPLMYLTSLDGKMPDRVDAALIRQLNISVAEVREVKYRDEVIDAVLDGKAAVLIDRSTMALVLSIPGWERRKVEEPTSEKVIRGPREGFTETLSVNVALIRRRIKDTRLKIKTLSLGTRSKTRVALFYMEDVIKKEILEEIEKRLSTVDFDMVEEVGTIEEFIEDNPYSPFPQVMITERPDKVVSNIAEGRACIMIDCSPFAMVMPITLASLYQSPEDYYERPLYGTAVRILRFAAFFIATSLPALYVAMVSFHHELIPSRLVLTLARGRVEVPFPAFLEALLMELTIEFIREASTRLPGVLSQTVGVVGGLVLGTAAVQANLVSPAMVIVVSLTAITTFTVPIYSLSYPIRIIRFPLMFLAASFGLFGLAFGWNIILIHLCTLESFGIPYLSPYAPLKIRDMKDAILRFPLWAMKKRPKVPHAQDETRLGNLKGDHKRD
ncbi:MAG TPA: spore germination protein [Clostridiales bacterium]|nr:spore germination protein [Clostridiales bacterium]